MCKWLYEVSEQLDDARDVLTSKALYNKLNIEISYGNTIEEVFGSSLTPETLLMLKEEIASKYNIYGITYNGDID